MTKRKHIALNESQQDAFREAKLLLQQEYHEPDLDDNETVHHLANFYIMRARGDSDDETENISK